MEPFAEFMRMPGDWLKITRGELYVDVFWGPGKLLLKENWTAKKVVLADVPGPFRLQFPKIVALSAGACIKEVRYHQHKKKGIEALIPTKETLRRRGVLRDPVPSVPGTV